MPDKFVEVRGQRLEFRDLEGTDSNQPPILLLHEGLGSVATWRDFPSRLAAATGCRVVAYSREGFGRSSPRRAPYTPRFMHEEALEVLPALRDALALERPVLVGHSTGASMALIHASAAPSKVAGVVAMAPLTFVEESNLASIRRAGEVYATTDLRAKLARFHDDVDAVFHGWRDIWLHPDFRAWSIAAELARIRCPRLVLLGDGDEYSTAAQVELIAKTAVDAASCEIVKIEGCGHAPHRDRPEVVIPAIARFVGALG